MDAPQSNPPIKDDQNQTDQNQPASQGPPPLNQATDAPQDSSVQSDTSSQDAPPKPSEVTPEPDLESTPPTESSDHGVGTPNIGVENDAKEAPEESATIEVAEYNDGMKDQPEEKPQPTVPATPPPQNPPQNPPQTQPSAGPRPIVGQEVQVKNYQNPNGPQTLPAQADSNASAQPQPPVKASSVNTFMVLGIIVALGLGSAGGFYGFKYFDSAKTSASTETSPQGESTSTNQSGTKLYTSGAYSFTVKYPASWSISTTDEQAEEIVTASNKESLSGELTGYRVDIVFQNNNGKTLKSWVEANAAAIGENSKAKEIIIDGKTAYQQELSKNGSQIATYVERPEKVMIVTYSAPDGIFAEGGSLYNNIINSLKLN